LKTLKLETRVEIARGFLMGSSMKSTKGERAPCMYNRLLIQGGLESKESKQQLAVI